jgi:O-antigen ligase
VVNLERAQLGLVAITAATCLVSIFAAQLALALALVVFLARLLTGRAPLPRTPLDGPILAFSVWTLLSASFSADPLASHDNAKKLLLFALVYLALDSAGAERDRERIVDAALLGGIALGVGAILQFHFLGFDTLNRRPHGFVGHYMTAAGLSMGAAVIAAARLAFRREPFRPSRGDVKLLAGLGAALLMVSLADAAEIFGVETTRLFVAGLAAAAAALALARGPWPAPSTGTTLAALALPICTWSLIISMTRNAWLGAVAGLAVVAALRAPRALWLLPTGLLAVLVLRPATVIDRLTLSDPSSVDRYYMWQAGLDMILDKPVFGQGPGMILQTYPHYRWPEAPNPLAPHLHDNALQITAERGLPCLVFWLWLVAAAMGDAWRECRRGLYGRGWVAPGALALLTAVMISGLFEYTFGDSEVLMFTLIFSAFPYALRRQRAVAPA